MLREISLRGCSHELIRLLHKDVTEMAICSSCNQNIEDGTKFCNNCGTAVGEANTASVAPTAQPAPMSGAILTKFCASCGAGLVASAVVCPSCGSAQKGFAAAGTKTKTVAVLLAVFLSAWTWVYTFSVNAKKFWIAAGLWGLCTILWIVGYASASVTLVCNPPGSFNCNYHTSGGGTILLAWLISFGVYLWAVIDTATKPSEYFTSIQ
jgi:predicted RNA-binding Zn-ribbon protein involved in translation (DUF1610 family)